MIRGVGLSGLVVRVDAPTERAVLGFEAVFNDVRGPAVDGDTPI
jgi:hypothetical protein